MTETLTPEEAEWRERHVMLWIYTDEDGILIDFDVNLTKLHERIDASGKEGFYMKAWRVPQIGKKCLFRASDPDEELEEASKGLFYSVEK